MKAACEKASVPRAVVIGWEDDEAFCLELALAWDDFVDGLLETMIRLARGSGRRKPNFTSLMALLNAFHDDFKTVGKEALESRISQVVLVICELAKRYIPPADVPKFQTDVDAAVLDASLGLRRRRKRE